MSLSDPRTLGYWARVHDLEPDDVVYTEPYAALFAGSDADRNYAALEDGWADADEELATESLARRCAALAASLAEIIDQNTLTVPPTLTS